MPTNFTRPTLATLIARVQADIESEVVGVGARLRRRFEFALSLAIAGVAHHLHGHLAWVAEQIILDQASEKFVLRWADLFDLARKPATPATGNLTVGGGSGAVLPAGTEFVRVSDGARYTVDEEHDPVGVSETVAVTAVVAGAAGNMSAGGTVQLVSPILGILSEAEVATGGLAGGADVESIEALRARTLERIQRPPRGGAPGDYAAWALEVPSVTRAWEYPRQLTNGFSRVGVVSLTFICEDAFPDGIPDEDARADVQAYIDERSPAEAFVFLPEPVALATTIKLSPNNSTMRDAVKAEIADLVQRERAPGTTLRLARLVDAIERGVGTGSYELVSPVADVTLTFRQLHVYEDPTFSTL